MPPPEVIAEVASKRAHVGARRTADAQAHVEHWLSRAVGEPQLAELGAEHMQFVDRDGARGELDLLAVAHALVAAHTVDLDGAHRARYLLDLAAQLHQRGLEPVVSDGPHELRDARLVTSPSASSVFVAMPKRAVAS